LIHWRLAGIWWKFSVIPAPAPPEPALLIGGRRGAGCDRGLYDASAIAPGSEAPGHNWLRCSAVDRPEAIPTEAWAQILELRR
jgi:hypothetical protein